MRNWKRLISLLLVCAMVVSYCPVSAFGAEMEETVSAEPEILTETPVETVEVTEASTEPPAVTTEATEAPTEEPEETTEAPAVTTEATEAPTEEPEETTEATEAPAETTEATEAPTEEPEETTEATEEPTEETLAPVTDDLANATIVASGECGAEGDNLTWTLDEEGTLTISGEGKMADFSYSGQPWYSYKSQITAVAVANTVTHIGDYAFYSCHNLRDVTLEEGLVSIGRDAFDSAGMESILIPDSVTTVGHDVFDDCDNMRAIFIAGSDYPASCGRRWTGGHIVVEDPRTTGTTEDGFVYVTTGAGTAAILDYTGSASTLVIPEMVEGCTVTEIAYRAFDGLPITGVTIPETIQEIGFYAFADCLYLEQIRYHAVDMTLPSEAAYNYVFANAGKNGSGIAVTIGACVEQIPAHLFCPSYSSCSWGHYYSIYRGSETPRITAIEFEAGSVCKKINRYAFAFLTDLKNMELPESIKGIDTGFDGSYNLILRCDAPAPGWNWPGVAVCSNPVETGITEEGIEYWITEAGEAVAAKYRGSGTSVVVPETINGYPVTKLAPGFLYDRGSITSVSLPDSITEIPSNAFYVCVALQSVQLPAQLQSIGSSAFYACKDLNDMTIPNTVTAISSNAFQNCMAMEKITIPEGVTKIEGYTFYNCNSLTEMTLPTSITNLETSAFTGCDYLRDLTFRSAEVPAISGNLTSLQRLQTVWVPLDSLAAYQAALSGLLPAGTVINAASGGSCGENAEWSLDAYGELTIRGSGDLAEYAAGEAPWYTNRERILSVTIGENITGIGSNAFAGCTQLQTVTFCGAVPAFGENCFADVEATVRYPVVEDSWTDAVRQNYGGTLAWESYMPIVVTDIFGTQLTWTLDKAGILTISGEGPMPHFNSSSDQPWYEYRDQILGVRIEEGVTQIKQYGFAWCANIVGEIIIPNSITYIGWNAFGSSSKVEKITIGSGVTEMAGQAFSGCWALEEVTFLGTTPPVGSFSFSSKSNLKTIYVPAGTLVAYTTALSGKIPGTAEIKEIEEETTTPDNTCGENLTWSFDEATGTLTISGTGAMTDYLSGSNKPWHSISVNGVISRVVIEDGVTTIGGCAFYGMEDLTQVSIPDTVTAIGDHAFYQCEGLTEITLPENLTAIGECAFNFCTGITKLTVPAKVTTIDGWAFAGCTAMEEMTFTGPAPAFGSNSMDMSALKTVWVPYEYLSDYQTALADLLPAGAEIMAVAAAGDCGENGGNVTWSLDSDGLLTISGTGRMRLSYTAANASGTNPAPWRAYEVKTVVVEEGVTYISDYAFYNESTITSVTLPDTLTELGIGCFYGTYISAITLPKGLTKIPESTFHACTYLREIQIPEGVTDIGKFAFYNCQLLKTVTMPDTVTGISTSAFYGCKVLENLQLSAGVTKLSSGTFHNCAKLKGLTFSPALTVVSSRAFDGCSNMTLTFTGPAPEFDSTAAFEGLTTAQIYYPALEAGWNTAANKSYGGTNITWVPVYPTSGTCGENLTWAFDAVTGTLTVSGTGAITDYTQSDPAPWTAFGAQIKDLVLEEGVTRIGDLAFTACEALENASFPSTLVQVGEAAFYHYQPGGVGDLATQPFRAKINQTVRQWSQVQIEENNEFFPAWDYEDIFVKEAPITASGKAGEQVYWELDEEGTMTFFGTGDMYSFGATASPHAERTVKAVNITEGITGIGECLFEVWEGTQVSRTLESVTIASSVRTIGVQAFTNCLALKSITFQGGAPEIIDGAFNNVTATAYYPGMDTSWTADKLLGYGGTITWEPYYKTIAEGTCGTDVQWKLTEDGKLVVSGAGAMDDYSMSNQPWYSHRSKITEIVIADDVTKIGKYAFYGCDQAVSLTIGAGVAEIGNYAFYNCNALTQIRYNAVNAANKAYENWTFGYAGSNGDGITVTVGSQVQRIPNYLFAPYYSSGLPKVVRLEFEEGSVCTEIGQDAFYNCDSLLHIQIPESLKTIGMRAFAECDYLNRIDFQAVSMDDLSGSVKGFNDIGRMGSGVVVNIGPKVQRIPGYLFDPYLSNDIPNLSKVVFDQNSACTEIGKYAFAENTLAEIVLPAGITTVGDYAFYKCTNLTIICSGMLPQTQGKSWYQGAALGVNPVEYGVDGAFSYWITQEGEAVIGKYLGSAAQVTVPAEVKGYPVTALGCSTFYDNDQLISVSLPQTLTQIGEQAFYSCNGMTSITLPQNVRIIGNSAFEWSDLAEVNLPESLEEIGDYAFGSCSELVMLEIPANVKKLGGYIIDRTGGYDTKYVRFQGDAPVFDPNTFCSPGARLIIVANYPGDNATWTAEVMQNYGTSTTTQWVPTEPGTIANGICGEKLTWKLEPGGTLTISGTGAMSNYSSAGSVWTPLQDQITKVVVEEGVTSLGGYAFYDCRQLETITVPSTLKNVGHATFLNCRALTGSPILPGSMTAIGNSPFKGCVSLDGTITIPKGVTEIGLTAFDGCTNLTGELVIPDKVTAIKNYAFRNCKGLESLVLPNSAFTVGEDVFLNCTGLKSVKMGDKSKYIGKNMFANCTGLSSFTIGENVTIIRSGAFSGCTGLDGTFVIPDKVTNVYEAAFSGCTGIDKIIFGSSVKSLEDTAFDGCTDVTEMTFKGLTAPEILCSFKSMTGLQTVYVPAASLQAYTKALSGKLPSGAVIKPDYSFGVEGLKASQVYSQTAVLSWDVHPGAAEGYVVYRDGVQIGTTGECSFVDTGLTPGQSYTYSVCADLGDALTEESQITVTTVNPEIRKVYTTGTQNRINDNKNQIFVQATDSGNLLPQGDRQTVLTLCYESGEEEILIGQGVLGENGLYTVTWDITGLEDGLYQTIARLTDVDGAEAEYRQEVEIDRSIPAAITGLCAADNVTKIDLTWRIAQEIDTVAYNIYRRADGETAFTLLAQVEGRNKLTYSDTAVAENGIYYYYITGVNELGSEGYASTVVGATLAEDDSAPYVDSLKPNNGSFLTGSRVILTVNAGDNVGITGIILDYSTDGSSWTHLAELEAGVTSYTLDSKQLPDGPVFLRATAKDAAGNTGALTYQYTVDNTGPDKVTGLSWESTHVTVTLRWANVQAQDVAFFRVEYQKADGSFAKLEDVDTTLGINLYDLTPDSTLTCRVVAYDAQGNRGIESDPVTVTTKADTTDPVITRLRPASGYYSSQIPLAVTAEDEYNVAQLAVEVSTDLQTWNRVHTQTYQDIRSSRSLSYSLALEPYAEGSLYVRAVATDSAGNSSDTGVNAPYVQYMVDKTPPAAPENVRAQGFGGYVEVSWNQGSEKDLNRYSVYRTQEESAGFTLIKSGLAALNYIDRAVEPGQTYYYQICVSDQAGNISPFSEVVSAQVMEDLAAPVIHSVYPADGASVGPGNGNVRISAEDDSGIASVRFDYSTDGETYALLKEVEATGSVAPVALPMDTLTHGQEIWVRVTVTDRAGNVSEATVVRYVADLEAPQVADGSASYDAAADNVLLHWTGLCESDLYLYRVYRTEEGKEKLMGHCKGETGEDGTRQYTFRDASISKEPVTYSYRIEAVDINGNTASHAPIAITLTDRGAPNAVISCDNTLHRDVEYVFDGSLSTDNGEIVSYLWDFGDGGTSDKEKPVHAYEEPGEYTITLTVTDDAGLTASAEKKVTVADAENTGTARIQILDEEGRSVANAPVYFDLGAENQTMKPTDNSGCVYFTATPGTHIVGCVIADNQWLPVKKEIRILPGQESAIAMTLVKQALVTGEFETNRMTFEEIQAAGIDVSKPENQHLMKAQVQLAYGTTSVVQTSFIFDMNGNIVPDEDGSDGSFVVPGGDIDNGDDGDRLLIPTVLNPGNSEAMTIAFLDLPVEASYLKEFFDVKLHILNNAPSDIALVDNVVTLKIPAGLSLVAGTESEANASVAIDAIDGQTTHTVSWILRGDKAGTYDLSADYSGTLAQFDEKINATFQSKEPVRVYGLETVKLVAQVAPSIHYGAFYFNLSLENDSSIDVNLPDLDLTGGVIDSYLIRIQQEAEGKEDTSLTDKTPRVQHLETLLKNSVGNKQTLDADTVLTRLAPGEMLTERYAVYNVVDYNNRLLLTGALRELQDQLGIRFQVVVGDMDLFNTDNALDKLAALSGEKKSMYDYILGGSQFFYVAEAVNRNESALSDIAVFDFEKARSEMALSSADAATVRAITRKLVAQLMVDDALKEAINGHVDDKYMQLVKKTMKDLEDYLGDKSSHIQTYFQAHMGKQDTLRTLAIALKHEGADGLIRLLIQELTALGMAEEDGTILTEYMDSDRFDQVQQAALAEICASHSELVADLQSTFDGWQRHAELLQTFLTINAAYEQTMELLGMLMQDPGLNDTVKEELNALKVKLAELNQNRKQAVSGKTNNGKGKDQDQILEDLEDAYGQNTNVPDTFARLMFGTMMDQISYWSTEEDARLVLQVHNELSMSLTNLVSPQKLDVQDSGQAVSFLNALKYLIQLRLLGEQSFAFFGDRSDLPEEQYRLLKWVNDTLGTEPPYDSLDAYAGYVLTLLQQYRDSIYIGSSVTMDVPDAPAVTIDYRKETTVESFGADYEYSFNGSLWITGGGSPIALNPGTVNKYLWVRAKATEDSFTGNTAKLLIPARPRILGDVTVIYDSQEYILTGLEPGDYRYEVTKDQNLKDLKGTFTWEPGSTGQRLKELHEKDIWMAIQAEATDTSFASVIRYVATRVSEYRWEIDYESGRLGNVAANTPWEEIDKDNQEHGHGNGKHNPNKNNKSNGLLGTGDTITLNTQDGEIALTVVVNGDVDGTAAVDQTDVDKLIGHVGRNDPAQKLENEYFEAGCVYDGRTEGADINIRDIYWVIDQVQGAVQ